MQMGVTLFNKQYKSIGDIPEEVIQREAAMSSSFNLDAVDCQIDHWEQKKDRAKTPIEDATACGVLHGLELTRILHGLPPRSKA